MLHSTSSTRAFNQAHRAELVPPSDLSGSGSTIASIAFTNRNSVDKNQAELFDLSVTDMQDLNSQANYEYYLKYAGDHGDTMNYSDTFEVSNKTRIRPAEGHGDTMNYSDRFELSGSAGDRAIKASGHYDLSTVDEEFSQETYSDQLELSRVVDFIRIRLKKPLGMRKNTITRPVIQVIELLILIKNQRFARNVWTRWGRHALVKCMDS